MQKTKSWRHFPFIQETFIESLLGLLIPPPPWTGRLVAASAKAISIIHSDGAMISVVGRPADMEARAMMPAEGFSDFVAKAAGLLEDCGRKESVEQLHAGGQAQAVGQAQAGGSPQVYGHQEVRDVNHGASIGSCWDGKQLSLVYPWIPKQPPARVPIQPQVRPQEQPQSQEQLQSQAGRIWPEGSLIQDYGSNLTVWDPRARLAEASRKYRQDVSGSEVPSGALPMAGDSVSGWLDGAGPVAGFLAKKVTADCTLAGEIRKLLTEAYVAGRRAEGLHGSGAFARGFRRLQAHPDFPAVVVGFGPGTTPAGDDWLAGCLVALDLRAGGPGKAALGFRQSIHGRLEQTTAAGRALLLGALAGAPPEYLVGLAEAAALQALGLGRLRVDVSNCLEHGATSGEDALAGFVYGLETNNGLLASE